MIRTAPSLRVVGMDRSPGAARAFRRALVLAGTVAVLAAAAPASAQFPFLGLSAVGAQAFDNENLLFYVPQSGDQFGAAVAAGDFNGDGIDDLATGIPFDQGLAGDPILGCGAVVVRYGAPRGGLALGLADDFLNQLASGSPDPAEQSELFGAALAAGDFDGDGIDDLAIGIPQNRTGAPAAGAVQIHYGRAGGIQLVGEHLLRPGAAGIPGPPENGARFGLALAAGNFDGDAYADLAVGAPNDDVGAAADAGSVTVFHGGANGLLPYAGYLISQDEVDIADTAEAGEGFGYSLAAGDFDGSGHDDLAIGVPFEDGLGAVQVLFGSQWGLLFANNQIYRRAGLGQPSTDGRFGWALASGDFDGDGRADLAIGDPEFDFTVSGNLRQNAGAIHVIYGSTAGPPSWFDLARTDFLHQGNLYGATAQQTDDYFGQALAAGDWNGDGRDDLAVGQPGENLGGVDRGGVTILTGDSPGGLAHYYGFLSPGLSGLPGLTQDAQAAGMALASGDFDANGHADLVLGLPWSDVAGIGLDTGAEVVFYGALFADGFAISSTSYWAVQP